MAKVWEILLQNHPEQLILLADYQWQHFQTKLDFIMELSKELEEEHLVIHYPTLNEIDKTIREKPKQERGKGW